jgi:hypothetical protein
MRGCLLLLLLLLLLCFYLQIAFFCARAFTIRRSKVTTYVFGRCERASSVLLRLEQDYVHFRNEQEYNDDRGAEARTQAKRNNFEVAAKVKRQKCQPYDTSGVHAEADEFCLVKIFGYIASSNRVQRAQANQKHVVAKRTKHGQSTIEALQTRLVSLRISDYNVAGLHYERGHYEYAFGGDYYACDYHLSSEAHETRLFCYYLLAVS